MSDINDTKQDDDIIQNDAGVRDIDSDNSFSFQSSERASDDIDDGDDEDGIFAAPPAPPKKKSGGGSVVSIAATIAVVAVGGGGLISGIGLVAKVINPKVRIVGVVAAYEVYEFVSHLNYLLIWFSSAKSR